jgi:hypothetical protein
VFQAALALLVAGNVAAALHSSASPRPRAVQSLITVGFVGHLRVRRETLSDVVEAGRADGVLTAGEIAVILQTTGASA